MSEYLHKYELTRKEVAEAIIKHLGIRKGLWALYLNIELLDAGPPDGQTMPITAFQVAILNLREVQKDGPLVVDAAKVHPQAKQEGV